jgi:hypothetical protein
MMLAADSDYGTIAPLVKSVGWLVSATAAIGLTWRRRARWEPAEQDVPVAPTRVAGVITAVFLAIIWSQIASAEHTPLLVRLALLSVGLCLISLLLYGFIISTNTYERLESKAPNNVETSRVIGGFSLTAAAQNAVAIKGLTVQELLRGAAYDVDKVWPRGSRAWAKLCFVVLYMMLTVSGTIALACGGVLLLLKANAQTSP